MSHETLTLAKFLDSLKTLEGYTVYCPVIQEGGEGFAPLENIGEELVCSMERVLFRDTPPRPSVKTFLFPDSEDYLEFRVQGNRMDVAAKTPEDGPIIVLGGKPCDSEGIAILNKVFLQEPVDGLYQKRQSQTVFIASICKQKGPNCLCEEFGVNPQGSGADIYVSQDQGRIQLYPNTHKGRELVEKLSLPLEAPPASDQPLQSLSPQDVAREMEKLHDWEFWDELAMRCLGCGICTYYCPTCHCYDVKDYARKNQGVRYRSWDSCMNSNFTNMAGGHNPRPSKRERIKNRFYHKLSYFVAQHGTLACVGCGRCAANCPVGISINTVLQQMGVLEDV